MESLILVFFGPKSCFEIIPNKSVSYALDTLVSKQNLLSGPSMGKEKRLVAFLSLISLPMICQSSFQVL